MTRKALLVGINDYAPSGTGGPDLRGCVNDVADMAGTLHTLGIVPIRPGQMRLLTNQRATRAAILEGFDWLVAGAKKGDTLVFHYSGHGSYMADTSGDDLDAKDETICPHDYASKGMIKDDEFRTRLSRLPAGVNLDILFDSCHSGTGTRELAALAELPEEQRLTFRYVDPPVDCGVFIDADPTLPVRRLLKPGDGIEARDAVPTPGLNHVLWAGCRDNQTSAEAKIDGVYRGVFTYCFCKMLRAAGTSVTRRRLDSLISVSIRRSGFGQAPQLEGTLQSINEKVFT